MSKAKTRTVPFDAAEYLDNPEMISHYLTEAFESGDADFIAKAIGDVARAQGMSGIAEAAGVSRESLYRSLSVDGNPELGTIMKVLSALGVKLKAEANPDEVRQIQIANRITKKRASALRELARRRRFNLHLNHVEKLFHDGLL